MVLSSVLVNLAEGRALEEFSFLIQSVEVGAEIAIVRAFVGPVVESASSVSWSRDSRPWRERCSLVRPASNVVVSDRESGVLFVALSESRAAGVVDRGRGIVGRGRVVFVMVDVVMIAASGSVKWWVLVARPGGWSRSAGLAGAT